MLNSLIFGLFDTIGRFLGGKIEGSEKSVIALSTFRILFIITTLAMVQSWGNLDVLN